VSHQVGLTLAQCSVDFKDGDKTNEIGAMPELLQNLVLEHGLDSYCINGINLVV
jgi:hypothetical protein